MATFRSSLALFILMAIIGAGDTGNVTYDGRSLIIDDQNKFLFFSSIHYLRSTPHLNSQMWPHLIGKAKSGGIDVIDTYSRAATRQGMVYREDTFSYLQYHMKRYAEMIVKLMKSENLYASQGGPITGLHSFTFMYISFEVSLYY
ncbi:unnamed protein product [Brassica rapa subsp. trilocularis]